MKTLLNKSLSVLLIANMVLGSVAPSVALAQEPSPPVPAAPPASETDVTDLLNEEFPELTEEVRQAGTSADVCSAYSNDEIDMVADYKKDCTNIHDFTCTFDVTKKNRIAARHLFKLELVAVAKVWPMEDPELAKQREEFIKLISEYGPENFDSNFEEALKARNPKAYETYLNLADSKHDEIRKTVYTGEYLYKFGKSETNFSYSLPQATKKASETLGELKIKLMGYLNEQKKAVLKKTKAQPASLESMFVAETFTKMIDAVNNTVVDSDLAMSMCTRDQRNVMNVRSGKINKIVICPGALVPSVEENFGFLAGALSKALGHSIDSCALDTMGVGQDPKTKRSISLAGILEPMRRCYSNGGVMGFAPISSEVPMAPLPGDEDVYHDKMAELVKGPAGGQGVSKGYATMGKPRWHCPKPLTAGELAKTDGEQLERDQGNNAVAQFFANKALARLLSPKAPLRRPFDRAISKRRKGLLKEALEPFCMAGYSHKSAAPSPMALIDEVIMNDPDIRAIMANRRDRTWRNPDNKRVLTCGVGFANKARRKQLRDEAAFLKNPDHKVAPGGLVKKGSLGPCDGALVGGFQQYLAKDKFARISSRNYKFSVERIYLTKDYVPPLIETPNASNPYDPNEIDMSDVAIEAGTVTITPGGEARRDPPSGEAPGNGIVEAPAPMDEPTAPATDGSDKGTGQPVVAEQPDSGTGQPVVADQPDKGTGQPVVADQPGNETGQPVVADQPGRGTDQPGQGSGQAVAADQPDKGSGQQGVVDQPDKGTGQPVVAEDSGTGQPVVADQPPKKGATGTGVDVTRTTLNDGDKTAPPVAPADHPGGGAGTRVNREAPTVADGQAGESRDEGLEGKVAPRIEKRVEKISTRRLEGGIDLSKMSDAELDAFLKRREEARDKAFGALSQKCSATATSGKLVFPPEPEKVKAECVAKGAIANGSMRLPLNMLEKGDEWIEPALSSSDEFSFKFGCQARCMCDTGDCFLPEVAYKDDAGKPVISPRPIVNNKRVLKADIDFLTRRNPPERYPLAHKKCYLKAPDRGAPGEENRVANACSGGKSEVIIDSPAMIADFPGELSHAMINFSCSFRCPCDGSGSCVAGIKPLDANGKFDLASEAYLTKARHPESNEAYFFDLKPTGTLNTVSTERVAERPAPQGSNVDVSEEVGEEPAVERRTPAQDPTGDDPVRPERVAPKERQGARVDVSDAISRFKPTVVKTRLSRKEEPPYNAIRGILDKGRQKALDHCKKTITKEFNGKSAPAQEFGKYAKTLGLYQGQTGTYKFRAFDLPPVENGLRGSHGTKPVYEMSFACVYKPERSKDCEKGLDKLWACVDVELDTPRGAGLISKVDTELALAEDWPRLQADASRFCLNTPIAAETAASSEVCANKAFKVGKLYEGHDPALRFSRSKGEFTDAHIPYMCRIQCDCDSKSPSCKGVGASPVGFPSVPNGTYKSFAEAMKPEKNNFYEDSIAIQLKRQEAPRAPAKAAPDSGAGADAGDLSEHCPLNDDDSLAKLQASESFVANKKAACGSGGSWKGDGTFVFDKVIPKSVPGKGVGKLSCHYECVCGMNPDAKAGEFLCDVVPAKVKFVKGQ